ncbi:molybdopterin-dependent oxidoreductase [Acidiphilium sp. PA]|uniref:molybdopterin-dependent oxidoreductase n=1 Tax=Acidiphilium sp. PA TaxID=2871705 RepID=UPI00224492BC|nr:molybdopterin-dependent oxidoreductase [Acidiphilium sp. PA]MCW8308920.1 molybdopterin-dependent oxidoreductase [Acidiphilium sp. PA]
MSLSRETPLVAITIPLTMIVLDDDADRSTDLIIAGPVCLQQQTLHALDFLGVPLTASFGAPLRLRIPTKLGYKNAKSIVAMGVTNQFPSGYWQKQG